MPFYKKDGESLLDAPNYVMGPGYSLAAAAHAQNTYPVDGWYWFDDLTSAIAFFSAPPDSVSMLSAQLALDDQGLLDQVNTVVAKLGKRAQITWAAASTVSKTNEFFNAIASQLVHPATPTVTGLSATQIDNLFAAARAYG